MNWLRRSGKRFKLSFGLWFMIVAQVLTAATIPSSISQALHVIINGQKMPLGTIVSVYPFVTFFTGLFFAGSVTDHFGPEKVLAWGLPILTGTYAMYSTSTSTMDYIITRVANGLVFAFVVNAFAVQVRNTVDKDSKVKQARVHGIILALNFLGSGVAMWVGLNLVPDRTVLWSAVLIAGTVAMVLAYWGMLLTRGSNKTWKQLVKDGFASVKSSTKKRFPTRALQIARPDIGVSSAYFALLTYYAIDIGDKPASTVLFFMTAATGGTAIFVFPKLVVRFNRTVRIGAMLILIPAYLSVMFVLPLWLHLVIGLATGVSMAGNNLAINEAVAHSVPKEQRGAATTVGMQCRAVGSILGPLYAQTTRSMFGATGMWLSLGVLVLGAMVLFLLKSEVQELVSYEDFRKMNKEPPSQALNALWDKQYAANRSVQGYPIHSLSDELKHRSVELTEEEERDPHLLMCRMEMVLLALAVLGTVQSRGFISVESEIAQVRQLKKGLRKLFKRGNHLHWIPEAQQSVEKKTSALCTLGAAKTPMEIRKEKVKVQHCLSAVQLLGLPGVDLEAKIAAFNRQNEIDTSSYSLIRTLSNSLLWQMCPE